MKNSPIVTACEQKPQAPSLIMMILLMAPLVLPLGMALDLYLPSIPSMGAALNCTGLEIQLTLTVFMYCFGFGQLIAGPITDSIGRMPVLYFSLLLFATGSALSAISSDLALLLVGRVFQAFGACGTQVVAFALVRDHYDGKDATLIYTSLKGAMTIAPILAPILGAFLQIHYGWQANFAVLSLYGISIWLLCYFALNHYQLNKASPKKGLDLKTIFKPYAKIITHPQFLYFGLCGLATQAAMFGYFSLSPQYYVKLHGLHEGAFAKLFSINAFTFLVTSLILGKKIFQWGLGKSTLIGASLLTLSGCLMIVGHHFFEHPYVLFLPNLIASSSAALMLGAAASGAMLPFKENAGSAAALFGCFEFIGGASIGQMAIWGDTISVLPMAGILISLSLVVGISHKILLNNPHRQSRLKQ